MDLLENDINKSLLTALIHDCPMQEDFHAVTKGIFNKSNLILSYFNQLQTYNLAIDELLETNGASDDRGLRINNNCIIVSGTNGLNEINQYGRFISQWVSRLNLMQHTAYYEKPGERESAMATYEQNIAVYMDFVNLCNCDFMAVHKNQKRNGIHNFRFCGNFDKILSDDNTKDCYSLASFINYFYNKSSDEIIEMIKPMYDRISVNGIVIFDYLQKNYKDHLSEHDKTLFNNLQTTEFDLDEINNIIKQSGFKLSKVIPEETKGIFGLVILQKSATQDEDQTEIEVTIGS